MKISRTGLSLFTSAVATVLLATSVGIAGPADLARASREPYAARGQVEHDGIERNMASTASFKAKLASFNEGANVASDQTRSALINRAGLTSTSKSVAGFTLDLGHATSLELRDGSFTLHVPFTPDSSVVGVSGTTFVFDSALKLAAVGDVVYRQQSPTRGSVEMWVNGQKVLDQIVVSDNDTPEDAGVARAFSWGKVNECLLNQGISQWLIAAVGVACSLLCTATLGMGCVACIAAFGGILGTTAGTCVAQGMAA
ncbi:MAG TPA: hypothetical protein VK139_03080 [Microbacteriaceae bacterium]|nr:hypothetical protein [Microbacteriaceae bacterium]